MSGRGTHHVEINGVRRELRRVALVDDVFSTGSTAEGDRPGDGFLALGHLPLFREE